MICTSDNLYVTEYYCVTFHRVQQMQLATSHQPVCLSVCLFSVCLSVSLSFSLSISLSLSLTISHPKLFFFLVIPISRGACFRLSSSFFVFRLTLTQFLNRFLSSNNRVATNVDRTHFFIEKPVITKKFILISILIQHQYTFQ